MSVFQRDVASVEFSCTSTDSPMTYQSYPYLIRITVFPTFDGTINDLSKLDWDLWQVSNRTSNGFALAQSSLENQTTQSALNELKRISGLTWEQLAKLFNVSRRSLHFWASGKPMRSFNEESLYHLLSTLRYIDRGSADVNRRNLMNSSNLPASFNNQTAFDLLVAGRYEDVKSYLGSDEAKPRIYPTQKFGNEQIEYLRPPKPEDLVGAFQDPIHKEVGVSRVVRATRSGKRDNR